MSCSSLIRCCPLPRFLAQREQKLTRHRPATEQALNHQQNSLQKDQVPSGREEGAGRSQEVSESMLRPPRKPERRRGRNNEAPARSSGTRVQEVEDESIHEQLSQPEAVHVGATSSPASSVASKQNSTSSMAEVVSEIPETASSQIRTEITSPQSETGSKIPSEYAQDTFESLDDTPTPTISPRPSQGVVATSTPYSAAIAATVGEGLATMSLPLGGDYSLNESLGLSESISGD